MAFGAWRWGGMISRGSLRRKATYIVLTVARFGARPGLTSTSERRSEVSVRISSAERRSSGSISDWYFQM